MKTHLVFKKAFIGVKRGQRIIGLFGTCIPTCYLAGVECMFDPTLFTTTNDDAICRIVVGLMLLLIPLYLFPLFFRDYALSAAAGR